MSKPFNLEAAKRGEPIMMGSKPAKFIAHVLEANESNRVAFLFNGFVLRAYENGKVYGMEEFLHMSPKKREGWVNVYPPHYADYTACVSHAHTSEEVANKNAESNRIACVRIEWEG